MDAIPFLQYQLLLQDFLVFVFFLSWYPHCISYMFDLLPCAQRARERSSRWSHSWSTLWRCVQMCNVSIKLVSFNRGSISSRTTIRSVHNVVACWTNNLRRLLKSAWHCPYRCPIIPTVRECSFFLCVCFFDLFMTLFKNCDTVVKRTDARNLNRSQPWRHRYSLSQDR